MVKKFWSDRNFSWYLAVSTINANLAHEHFQKGGKLSPTLKFLRELDQELLKTMLEKKMGVEVDHKGIVMN